MEQNTTTTKQEQPLAIQNNVDDNHNKNYPLIERIHVPNTPFWKLKTEQGWFLAMGEHRLTEIMETEKEVDEYIYSNDWELITQLIVIVTKKLIKEENDRKYADNDMLMAAAHEKIAEHDRMTRAGL